MHAPVKLYHGSVVHSLSLDDLEYAVDTLICVSDQGIILWIERSVDPSLIQQVASTHGLILDDSSQSVEILQLEQSEFLCPGLIDTHTVSSYQSPASRTVTLITSLPQHAPQYPNLGVGQEYQLLDWLSNVTFPREQMFADERYAAAVYDEVVKRTLAVGVSRVELDPDSSSLCPEIDSSRSLQVTTASYYASLHESASKILADTTLRNGEHSARLITRILY